MVLASLLELTKDPSEKKRIFDDFAFIFMLNLKIFQIHERRVGQMVAQKALRTKDIIWAMHSNQKVTTFSSKF